MVGNNLTIMFFAWWYGEAYARLLKYIKASYVFFTDLFSVRICLRTLFAPWKRDEISYEGLSLQQKFQVWTLNLASRLIGAAIKTITIFLYIIFIIFLSVFSLTAIIIWTTYPLIIVFLIWRASTTLRA